MFRTSPVPLRQLLALCSLLLAVLLALGCVMPSADLEPAEPKSDASAATATIAEEPDTGTPKVVGDPMPILIVRSLPTATNVRAGPGLVHTMTFHVYAGTELLDRGRNADGTWLQAGFEEWEDWINGYLTDIADGDLTSLDVTVESAVQPPPEPVPAAEPPAITAADEATPEWLRNLLRVLIEGIVVGVVVGLLTAGILNQARARRHAQARQQEVEYLRALLTESRQRVLGAKELTGFPKELTDLGVKKVSADTLRAKRYNTPNVELRRLTQKGEPAQNGKR